MFASRTIFYALWQAFLASSIIVSPLQNLYPRAGPDLDENIPLNSGILRYGFEFETILELKPGNPKTHPALEKIMKEGQEAYIETINSDRRLKNGLFGASSAYDKAFLRVREFLVEEWNRKKKGSEEEYEYEPSPEVLARNKWLRAATEAMKINPALKDHTFKRHPLVNRYRPRDLLKDQPEPIRTWSITKDGSLYKDYNKDVIANDGVTIKSWQFAIEFISPILPLGASDYWYMRGRYPIELFLSFLLDHCGFHVVQKPVMASSHVHVSPRFEQSDKAKPVPERLWTNKRTKRMLWSALFFEPAIRSMLPEGRLMTPWANEWHHPKWIEYMGLKGDLNTKEKVFSLISSKLDQTITSNEQVKMLMNPYIYPRMEGRREIPGSNRYWGWNFNNLPPGENVKGTIECRRGGQSRNADDAMFNIELVAAFALAACANGDYNILNERFDFEVKDLKSFIYDQWPIPNRHAVDQNLKEIADFSSGYQTGFKFPELEKRFASLNTHSRLKEDVKFPEDLEIEDLDVSELQKAPKEAKNFQNSPSDAIQSEEVHTSEIRAEWKDVKPANLQKAVSELQGIFKRLYVSP